MGDPLEGVERSNYDSAMTRAGNVLMLLAMVLAGGAIAACSSDDASPASGSVVETLVATTEPVVTSTSPSTTESPPTTTDPAETLAAEVEADFLEADRLGREASQDPFNAEKEQAALDRRVGFAENNFRNRLAEYRAQNYAIRPSPSTPASVIVEVPAALVPGGEDVAQIQICEVDSWVVVEVGAGPDGSDAIVNPDVATYRSTVLLREVGGTWKLEGGSEIGRWEGATECPAE